MNAPLLMPPFEQSSHNYQKSENTNALSQIIREKIETIISLRSRNETLIMSMSKVWSLKQNRLRFCFKILALIFSKELFHKVDPRIGWGVDGI